MVFCYVSKRRMRKSGKYTHQYSPSLCTALWFLCAYLRADSGVTEVQSRRFPEGERATKEGAQNRRNFKFSQFFELYILPTLVKNCRALKGYGRMCAHGIPWQLLTFSTATPWQFLLQQQEDLDHHENISYKQRIRICSKYPIYTNALYKGLK
jgi:hypothetical protein